VVGDLEGPADGAAVAGVDVGGVEREGSERGGVAGLLREGRGVWVCGVDVGEGDGAGGVEIAGPVHGQVFGDRAGLGRGGDERGFVGAGDGDGDGLRVGAAMAV